VIYAIKIRKFGLTHIHAHFALDASTYAMFCSMLTGIPYSFTIHAHDIFLPTVSSFTEEKFKSAKFVACISEYNKKYILQQYQNLDSDHIKIVHCGVNTQELNPEPLPRNQKFMILSVGRLAEQKGFCYLILACELLRKSQQLDFVCKIIGEGKERSLLEELIVASGLEETVHLMGAMEQQKVLEALKTADVFVLPCVVEKTNSRDGIPVALMEAMALEIPVISTTVSGIPELVKDGAGFLVAPEDPKALAETITKVCTLSPESRKALGRRCRAIVAQEFNLEKEVEKLMRLFKN
jgi:glycosyltransferase involved in cell wall biosynthesis